MSVLLEMENNEIELTKKLLTCHIEEMSESWDRLYVLVGDIRERTSSTALQNVDWSAVFAIMREEIDVAISARQAITYQETSQKVTTNKSNDFEKMRTLNL